MIYTQPNAIRVVRLAAFSLTPVELNDWGTTFYFGKKMHEKVSSGIAFVFLEGPTAHCAAAVLSCLAAS